jgi:hypothetical protein
MESLPEPTIRRKIDPRIIAQSVLAACAISQNPSLSRIGIFVELIAVIIIIINGNAAYLVNKPIKINTPQTISKEATK